MRWIEIKEETTQRLLGMVSKGDLDLRDLKWSIRRRILLGLEWYSSTHWLPLRDAGKKNRSQLKSNRNPGGGKSYVKYARGLKIEKEN